MNYYEVIFQVSPTVPGNDILIAELAEVNFESFEETESGVKAYIQEPLFDKVLLDSLPILQQTDIKIRYEHQLIKAQNWNAVWEKSYEPVEVENKCIVRAHFHEVSATYKYDILIHPKMSFGTGHHSTTYLMIKELVDMDVEGKTVLDMGCGTAVLAILSAKKGAKEVLAIDIDEWAYENAVENCKLNEVEQLVTVEKGSVEKLQNNLFSVILANINKNVILEDLTTYNRHLTDDGLLVVSGFFESDIDDINEALASCGMKIIRKDSQQNWAMLVCRK